MPQTAENEDTFPEMSSQDGPTTARHRRGTAGTIRWRWPLAGLLLVLLQVAFWTQVWQHAPRPAESKPLAQTLAATPPLPMPDRAQPDAPESVPPLAEAPARPTPAPRRSTPKAAPPRLAKLVVQRRSRLPVGPLAPFYQGEYAKARSGNADAIYQLGLVLKECSAFDATPQALKTSIETMYRTRRLSGMAVDDPEWAAGELRRRYARCEGIAPDARERYYDVMARAADGGSVEALESMVFQLPPKGICRELRLDMCDAPTQAQTLDLRARQADWLRRAQQLGSANALWHLGAAYLNGEMAPVDKQQAYAYLRAYQLVSQAFRLEDKAAKLVSQLRRELPKSRVAEAEAQAKAYIANPACCLYLR